MGRYLLIRTKSELYWLKLGVNTRPLTTWKNRIFRTDERLMIPDTTGGREFVMYDVDGTQPYGSGERLDPDETMAIIDVAKTNGGKGVSKIDFLNRLDSKVYIYAIVGIVLVFSLIKGGLA